MRAIFVQALAVVFLQGIAAAAPRTVAIGVLGLFRPQSLTVTALEREPLRVVVDGSAIALDSSQDPGIRVKRRGEMLSVIIGSRTLEAHSVAVSGDGGLASDFLLAVPGKIHRRYLGTLNIVVQDRRLLPIVHIALETAVASVVAAESPPEAPMDELKAQAIASRSYFVAAKHRHPGFDFCDTTHCQFLRAPPPAGSPSARATQQTEAMVLTLRGKVIAASYRSGCSYPWVSPYKKRPAGGDSSPSGEARQRIQPAAAMPPRSQANAPQPANSESGLCQNEAAKMARSGEGFAKILQHFYPNAEIANLEQLSPP